MIRDRLKEIDIKITELADYLQISRPTMYKFLEFYEQAEFSLINKNILKLLNYINDNPLVGKRSVISFILNNLSDTKICEETPENKTVQKVKNFIYENPNSSKSMIIKNILNHRDLDVLVNYLAKILPLLKKKRLNDDEKALIEPYRTLLKEIKSGGN